MPSPLAEAHVEAQGRLRRLTVQTVEQIWRELPAYDRANVDQWLAQVLPVVDASQRTSAALLDGFVATYLNQRPAGVARSDLTIRNGADPAEVYERPFITLWSALGSGAAFEDASSTALARATSTAAMDVQLAMRETAAALEEAAAAPYGYERVANPGACEFCQAVNGAYVKASDGFAMDLHVHCGCGLEPLTEPHRGAVKLPDGTEIRSYQYGPLNDKVAVREHGELGPVLVSPDHDFTSESDI